MNSILKIAKAKLETRKSLKRACFNDNLKILYLVYIYKRMRLEINACKFIYTGKKVYINLF